MVEAKCPNAQSDAIKQIGAPLTETSFLRLSQIVGPGGILPVSRSNFYAKIKSGKIPAPIKFGRISLWRAADINQALDPQ